MWVEASMPVTRRSNWANVDVTNPVELAAMREQASEDAARRVSRAVEELKRLGIVDAEGRRIRKDLPEDMQEGSDCDFSAL